ncbi:response regulator [Undibacterium sp. Ji22W]|uniref:response regulator n=1 Tax=Undibacterium sp. Ji22W TaxID=3413038 RepID=UPI003BEFF0EB
MTTAPTTHHILLAEDNDFNQEIVVELLNEAGYAVTATNNGQETLKELYAKPNDFYQLILMDLEMPVLDGHQATIEIRKNPQFEHIPIIAMTAHTQENTKVRCAQEGMQDYISKPFDPTALYKIIHRWSNGIREQAFTTNNKVDVNNSDDEMPCFNFNTIDSQRGVQLSGNNISLYLQLLRRFQVSQTDTLFKLSDLEGVDFHTTEFKRMIHTLKGVSGTIGASQLADLIEEYEVSLDSVPDGQSPMTNANVYLLSISNLLRMSLDEIRQFFTSQGPAPIKTDAASSTPEELHFLVESLVKLLESASTDAIDYFDEHRLSFEQAFGHQHASLLSASINQYDFDQAISQLRSPGTDK